MSSELSEQTLKHSLLIIESLAPLLIRSGVGYGEFASACKPVFYRTAVTEAIQTQQKQTDSAISLLSGLHRRDTASLRKAIIADPTLANPPISQPVSVPKQVIARWLSQDIGETLILTSDDPTEISFASLVAQVSKDQHFRSILVELQRIGIVEETDGMVKLKRQAFTPDPHLNEAREIFAQNVADHISAGVTNLLSNQDNHDVGVLEQAIFSDELSKDSIDELHTLANELWTSTLNTLLKRAIELHERDQPLIAQMQSEQDQQASNTQSPDHPSSYRFRLGMYAYHEPENHSSSINQ